MKLILIATMLAAAAILPAAAFAHGGTEVTVKGDVRPNGPIQVTGKEFSPNDVVRIELRKAGVEPVELGRVPADAEGNFDETLHVPASLPAGLYQLAADGTESATTELTILEPATGAPAAAEQPVGAPAPAENQRPTGETIGLAVFTAVIAVAAAGLLWVSRTRAHAPST